jgi:hypothetical protein
LKENKAMQHVFEKHYPNAKVINTGSSEVTFIMDFDPKMSPDGTSMASGRQNGHTF